MNILNGFYVYIFRFHFHFRLGFSKVVTFAIIISKYFQLALFSF